MPFAALLAVTKQVVNAVTVNEVPEIAHPAVVVAKLTEPSPEPPLEVSVIVSPATAVFVALLTVSVDCGAAVNVKLTAAEFAAP